MKARKLPELYFARIQIVKGRFKARIYGLEGAVNLGKPLEPNEVRVTIGPAWEDVVSYSLDAIHDYVDKIMGNQNPAKKTISDRPKPRRSCLVEAFKAQKRAS